MNWNDAEERPNWPEELNGPVNQLGNPSAVHRTSPKKAFNKTMIGIGLLLLGAIMNYLFWFVFKLIIIEKYIFLLLFGTPGAGIWLIYSAIRDRGMWVLIYPMGLLRWHRNNVLTFPWDEVEHLFFHRLTSCEGLVYQLDDSGLPLEAYIPLEGHTAKILGSRLLLLRGDGEQTYVPSSIEDFSSLGQRIQIEHFRRNWPLVWEQYQAREIVSFGDLYIHYLGIRTAKDSLTWAEVEKVSIANSKIVIQKKGKKWSWCEIAINQLPNPHLFLALFAFSQFQFLSIPEVQAVDDEEEDE